MSLLSHFSVLTLCIERQQDARISADNEIDDSDDEADPGLTKRKDRSIDQNIPIPSTSSTIDIPPLPPVPSTSTSTNEIPGLSSTLPVSETAGEPALATVVSSAPTDDIDIPIAPATNGSHDVTMG